MLLSNINKGRVKVMDKKHAKLMAAIIKYNAGDPMRIHHLTKVHDFAATIGVLEGIDVKTLDILESACILHDIGIHISEKKYGSSNGKYQEIEGPGEARALLEKLGGYSKEEIERICYLIGHHHTYKNIDGLDYQILIEADFLVNIYEDNLSQHAIDAAKKNIFKTKAGLELLHDMFNYAGYTPL